MPKCLKPFLLGSAKFDPGDEFTPESLQENQDLSPYRRDRIICSLLADGYVDEIDPNWLETEEAREQLFNDPRWAKSSYCGKCKKTPP